MTICFISGSTDVVRQIYRLVAKTLTLPYNRESDRNSQNSKLLIPLVAPLKVHRDFDSSKATSNPVQGKAAAAFLSRAVL